MKVSLLCLLIFIFLSGVQGQQFAVQLSEPQKELGYMCIPITDGGFLAIQSEDKRGFGNWNKFRRLLTLIRCNKDLNPIKKLELKERNLVFSVFLSELRKVGDKYFLFYIEPAEGNNIGNVKATEINPITLEPGTSKTLITGSEMNLSLKLVNGLGELSAKVQPSPDESHIGLSLMNGKSEMFMAYFDKELNTVWSRREVNTTGKGQSIRATEVDNNGNFYLGYTSESKGYVAVYNKEKTPAIITVDGANAVYDVALLARKSSPTIAVAGLYWEATENLSGVYQGTINPASKSINSVTKTHFPDNIVQLFDKDGFANTKAGKYGLKPGFLSQLIELEDGSLDFLAEAKQVTGGSTYDVLHSGPILNVYFGASNPTFARLPKYNVSTGGTFWKHFSAFAFKNKIIVFYNDNPVNLSKGIDDSPKTVNIEDNSVLVAAVIEPDGTVKRVQPVESKEKYMGIAEYIRPLSERSFVLPLYGKKKSTYTAISVQ